jgi:two-component system chemotaxis sensor kinase CheA
MDTSALLGDYLDDAVNHLDALDSALLETERDRPASGLDRELITNLLGSLHTLKGNSGMMGFVTVQKFVHQFEGVFKRLLDAPGLLTQDVLDALFESATILRNAVEQIGADPQPDLSQETAFLESLATGSDVGLKAAPHPDGPADAPAASDEAKAASPAKSNILRVDFERLDQLLNLAGELVIHKTKLNQIAKKIEDLVGGEEFFGDLPGLAQLIEKTTGELQEAIMRVRMLPVRQVFQRFPRMVRDLAKQNGKEVEFSVSGEDTEIDKTVIDALGDPLIHLIRNAIDHGIERPDEREASGKPRTGRVTIRAYHQEGSVFIEVSDDGRGMDKARIRRKAESLGIVKPGEEVSDGRLLSFLFLPGFSTAEKVGDLSGRGVGMDVVKTNIESLRGNVDIETEAGKGSTFRIKMPLTLAIIEGMLLRVGKNVYIIPLLSIVESLKPKKDDIRTVKEKGEVIQVRGEYVSLVRLYELFGVEPDFRDPWESLVVIVEAGMSRVGVMIDELMGQQQIVIKSIENYITRTRAISGAAILGDGRVALIIDVHGLVEEMVK